MILPPGFERHSLSTALGTVRYAAADEACWGPPPAEPLVFFHGFGAGSSGYEWSKVYPAFAPLYRVLVPDLVGWGASERPRRTYSATDYTQHLGDILDALSPEPVWVVASSLTAALVVQVAVAQPQRFRGLVLVAPAGLKDFGTDLTPQVIADLTRLPGLDQVLYHSALANPEAIRLFLNQRQFADGDRIATEMVEAYTQSAQQPNADVAAFAFVRGDLSVDLAADLPHLTVPTVVLWGEQAQFTPIELGRRLVALNPAAIAHFVAMPQVGLTPQLEQPSATIGLVRSYLRQLAALPHGAEATV